MNDFLFWTMAAGTVASWIGMFALWGYVGHVMLRANKGPEAVAVAAWGRAERLLMLEELAVFFAWQIATALVAWTVLCLAMGAGIALLFKHLKG